MHCSPQLPEPPTRLPAPLRNWLGARLGGPAAGPRRHERRAALFALGRVGDVVLALGAVRRLLREFGPDPCTLILPAHLTFLAERECPGVEVIGLPGEGPSLVRDILPAWRQARPRLGGHRFEHRICLSHQRPLYYEIALTWIDAARDWRLLPATYPVVDAGDVGTELRGHHRLVETVLGRTVPRAEILPRLRSWPVDDDGRLLVFPLSLDPQRSLGPVRTAEILRARPAGPARPVVFGGAPSDATRLRDYVRAAGLPDATIETPEGIPALVDQIARAGRVLATDSAPAHLAIALDKRCVTLTTPAYFGYCQPWANSARQRLFLQDEAAATVAAALEG